MKARELAELLLKDPEADVLVWNDEGECYDLLEKIERSFSRKHLALWGGSSSFVEVERDMDEPSVVHREGMYLSEDYL